MVATHGRRRGATGVGGSDLPAVARGVWTCPRAHEDEFVRVESASEAFWLRVATGVDTPQDDVEREARIVAALHAAGVRVAAPVARRDGSTFSAQLHSDGKRCTSILVREAPGLAVDVPTPVHAEALGSLVLAFISPSISCQTGYAQSTAHGLPTSHSTGFGPGSSATDRTWRPFASSSTTWTRWRVVKRRGLGRSPCSVTGTYTSKTLASMTRARLCSTSSARGRGRPFTTSRASGASTSNQRTASVPARSGTLSCVAIDSSGRSMRARSLQCPRWQLYGRCG